MGANAFNMIYINPSMLMPMGVTLIALEALLAADWKKPFWFQNNFFWKIKFKWVFRHPMIGCRWWTLKQNQLIYTHSIFPIFYESRTHLRNRTTWFHFIWPNIEVYNSRDIILYTIVLVWKFVKVHRINNIHIDNFRFPTIQHKLRNAFQIPPY